MSGRPWLTGGPWATGVGSLPFTDEASAASLLARFAEVPFLPELPALDVDEALVRRPFAGLLEAGDLSEARLRVPVDEVARAPVREGRGAALLEAALAKRGGETAGVAKVQLAGPCVLGSWVSDSRGRNLGSTEEGRTLALGRVEAWARSLVARLGARARLLVVLDEPGLGPDGTALARAVLSLRGAGASVVGVHDCGHDFRRALAAKPDLLAFDFASFGALPSGPSDPLATFVRSGGSLAWGAVSTLPGGLRRFDASRTADAIRAAARSLAGDEAGARALLDRSLVSPACGTALLPGDEARAVHEGALEVARLLREAAP